MGPKDVGGPDDLEHAVVGFLDAATANLDIAIQEVDSKVIAKAGLDARARGVRMRVVLEADYLRAKRRASDPWKPGGPLEVNREIHNAILRSGIRVWSDFNTDIFHQKFIIRDRSAVLTGSTNFTETGTHANLNHLVIVEDEEVARIYGREFREIRQGHFGKLNEGHDPAPDELVVSNVPIKILFAPDHNPEMEIMKQMMKARTRIDFAIFTFSQSSGIDDTLVRLKELGMPIRGVLDAAMGNQPWAATRLVHNAGIPVWTVGRGNGVGKLHHKLMVLDGQVVITGSFNYTRPANELNDENIMILGCLDPGQSAASLRAQRKLGAYALEEIDRIIRDHGQRVV
jgi:phosphatidylserine/phosphatidylglycerophosphate/cardiolipin synthase-like enzyme